MHYLAVVTQIDIPLQALWQGIVVEIQVAVVNDQCIELVTGLETAYAAEKAAC